MIIETFLIILQETAVSWKSHLLACHPDVFHHRTRQHRRGDHQSADAFYQIRNAKDAKRIADEFSEKFSDLPCGSVHFHRLLFETQCIQIVHSDLILLLHKILHFQSEMPFILSRLLTECIRESILSGSHLHWQGNRFSLTAVVITQL